MPRFYRALILAIGLATVTTLGGLSADEIGGFYLGERESGTVLMSPTAILPGGRLETEASFRNGRARIEMKGKKWVPAFLLGGDMTAWVAWAIAPDGSATRLGELDVRGNDVELEAEVQMATFGLLVTAETDGLVSRPSEHVLFRSRGRRDQDPVLIELGELLVEARVERDTLDGISFGGDDPAELEKARLTLALAQRLNAPMRAPIAYRDARVALGQAEAANQAGKKRDAEDLARRAAALGAQALDLARRRLEAETLESEIDDRLQQRRALELELERTSEAFAEERRAAEARQRRAELDRAEVEARLAEARFELDDMRRGTEAQRATAASQLDRLATERDLLSAETASLQGERDDLELELTNLRSERDRIERERAAATTQSAATSERLEDLEARYLDLEAERNGLATDIARLENQTSSATLLHQLLALGIELDSDDETAIIVIAATTDPEGVAKLDELLVSMAPHSIEILDPSGAHLEFRQETADRLGALGLTVVANQSTAPALKLLIRE